MIGRIASSGRLSPASGLTTRAISPTAGAPLLADRPRPQAAVPPPAWNVALAPAAMSALIDAQARLDDDPPPVGLQA